MNEKMFEDRTGRLSVNNFKPSYSIEMRHGTGQVGRLDFNGPKLVFTGDAEESAKVFVNYLTMIWEKRIQEEREAEREACAKTCEEQADSPALTSLEQYRAKFIADAIRARGKL